MTGGGRGIGAATSLALGATGYNVAVNFAKDETAASQSLAKRVYAAVPAFIILFVVAAAANTAGLIGPHAMQVQMLGRIVMVVALAAVGLQGHWRAFVGAGSRPLVLGLVTWFVVAASSLAVQTWTHAL